MASAFGYPHVRRERHCVTFKRLYRDPIKAVGLTITVDSKSRYLTTAAFLSHDKGSATYLFTLY